MPTTNEPAPCRLYLVTPERLEPVAFADQLAAALDGGGNGSIIGRNTFQRPKAEALALLDRLVNVYLGKD